MSVSATGSNEPETQAPTQRHWHAITRAWQRYGLLLTATDCADLSSAFRQGRTLVHCRGPGKGRSTHLAKIRGTLVRVVFSEINGYVVTFLPLNESYGQAKRKPRALGNKKKGKRPHKIRQRRPEVTEDYDD